jgi:hypothetical protein
MAETVKIYTYFCNTYDTMQYTKGTRNIAKEKINEQIVFMI